MGRLARGTGVVGLGVSSAMARMCARSIDRIGSRLEGWKGDGKWVRRGVDVRVDA